MISLYIKETMKLTGRKPSPFALTKIGVSRNNASRLLNNQSASIKLKTLFELCQLLQCTPNDLFDIPDNTVKALPKGHPLLNIKKSPAIYDPSELVKTLPINKIQRANELLRELKEE